MASAFGARFDMEIDALLILVLAILAWQHDKAGAWVLAVGAAALRLRRGRLAVAVAAAPLPPSRAAPDDLRRPDRRR